MKLGLAPAVGMLALTVVFEAGCATRAQEPAAQAPSPGQPVGTTVVTSADAALPGSQAPRVGKTQRDTRFGESLENPRDKGDWRRRARGFSHEK